MSITDKLFHSHLKATGNERVELTGFCMTEWYDYKLREACWKLQALGFGFEF